MRGIYLRAYVDFIEESFGTEFLEKVLSKAKIANKGAYTSLGDYPEEEFYAMVQVMAEMTGQPFEKVMEACGKNLGKVYHSLIDKETDTSTNAIELLKLIVKQHSELTDQLYLDEEVVAKADFRPDEGGSVLKIHYQAGDPSIYSGYGVFLYCLEVFNETADIDIIQPEPGNMCKATYVISNLRKIKQ